MFDVRRFRNHHLQACQNTRPESAPWLTFCHTGQWKWETDRSRTLQRVNEWKSLRHQSLYSSEKKPQKGNKSLKTMFKYKPWILQRQKPFLGKNIILINKFEWRRCTVVQWLARSCLTLRRPLVQVPAALNVHFSHSRLKMYPKYTKRQDIPFEKSPIFKNKQTIKTFIFRQAQPQSLLV